MNKKLKSLLIHNDKTNNKAIAMIVEEKNFLQKTKEFLENIKKKNKENLSKSIILSAEGDNHKFTVAYEKDSFVIVAKKGIRKSAKLYGNWDEALNFARNLLKNETKSKKDFRIVLAEYASEN